jgi:copper(I)-binding protein
MRAAVLAGLLAVALGVAALVRGALPESTPAGPSGDPIVVTDAWVQAPVPPTKSAAGYFTVTNNTDADVHLVSVSTSAGATSTLHTDGMTALSDGAVIPAHGRLVLSTGQGHLMIENLFGDLEAGQRVTMQFTFTGHDPITVTANVYAPGTRP